MAMQDALGSPQSVLLLGGTSEIGLAIVRRLVGARAGRVVLAVRRPDEAKAAAEELEQAGARVQVVAFDALDTASHRSVLDPLFDADDLDLVILAFGTLGDQAEFDADPELAVLAAQTNYVGSVSAGLVVADRFRRQGHGTLVVLSSVAGERARASNYVYGSTKAGLDAFAQGLGDSLLESGARVLVVRPGFVHTRMTAGMEAQPFSTTPEVVAEQVMRGLAANRDVVWAPPILHWVFAGMRHLPRRLWRVISSR
jgi:decaprenylphospho-beta-D-erythro-pentofuranosid-2-ulose 2-reductase